MKKYLDMIVGIVLIIYIVIINFISNTKIAFSLPVLALGIILILYHLLREKIKGNTFLLKVLNIIKIFVYIGAICFLGIEIAIISYPKHNTEKAEYIIILGAGLTNQTTPNLILQGRLNEAIKYINENNNAYIVLSGGQGSDEKLPESHAMKLYLQESGIDSNKIIIEDKSRDTNENFKFSKVKIEEHSKKSISNINVKIITTDFHALRSSILARKNGYIHYSNYCSTTVCYLIPITYTREAFAIIKSILFD